MASKAKDKIKRDLFKGASEEEVLRRRIQEVMDTCPRDFIHAVQAIADSRITSADIQIQKYSPHHHLSEKLPAGMVGASVFLWDYQGTCWKIAKFRTQQQINRQYDPRVRGSLAGALLKRLPSLGKRHISDWMQRHAYRFDFLISKDNGKGMFELLDLFLRIRLHPLH